MRKFLIFLIIILLPACDNGISGSSSSYDKGYQDAYDGAIPRSKSSEYLSGYEDGDYDGECDYLYDTGKWSEFKRLKC